MRQNLRVEVAADWLPAAQSEQMDYLGLTARLMPILVRMTVLPVVQTGCYGLAEDVPLQRWRAVRLLSLSPGHPPIEQSDHQRNRGLQVLAYIHHALPS